MFNAVARIFSLVLNVGFLGSSFIVAGSFMVIRDGLDFFVLSLVALPAWKGLGLFEIQTSFKVSKTSPTFTNLCTILRCLLILSRLGV